MMWKSIRKLFSFEDEESAECTPYGKVASDATRCVQCGICGYNCPVGIHVRDYACRGLPIDDASCIGCGNCINMCPRGTLRWETDPHQLVVARFADKMGERTA